MLHDDLAAFIRDTLKRRPMVLPVVVEVWLCLPAGLRAQSGDASLDSNMGSGGLGSCGSCGDEPTRAESGGASE
jgi:hypothetical protein